MTLNGFAWHASPDGKSISYRGRSERWRRSDFGGSFNPVEMMAVGADWSDLQLRSWNQPRQSIATG
jgi:hypothetical protein